MFSTVIVQHVALARNGRAPHHMKAKSAGKPVYALPLVLFSDDTSSNKSKKWHKFISWYLKLAGLSGQTSSKV